MTKTNSTTVVDAYAQVCAQIADLEKAKKALREQIIELGVGSHEGELFKATVVESERETLDMDAVREKLSPQFIRAHTRVTPVTTIRTSAR